MIQSILEKAYFTNSLTKNEIIELLLNKNDKSLYTYADKICKKYKGNFIHLRGLIEFTNVCKNDCLYCGIRCSNKKVQRYRLTNSQIIDCIKTGLKNGYKTVVLQGGEDSFFDCEKIIKIIKQIKQYDIALTLSIGERTYDEYKLFKEAGADRYLIRIETTDKNLYYKMHPNMSYDNRKNCIYNLKSLGYETGTGCIVGLAGQTIESLAQDILFFKEVNADMIGIGPFIPHPETPLANESNDNFDLALRVMAVTRLLLPDINIPATTAMETLRPDGRIIALKSGANVIMDNITLAEFKNKYEIYPDKKSSNRTKETLQKIGLFPSSTKGFRSDNH